MDGDTEITAAEVIDSREVNERIAYLRAEFDDTVGEGNEATEVMSEDDWAFGLGAETAAELVALIELAEWGEREVEEWQHGETLVRENYFEEYAKQLAIDCAGSKEEAELLEGSGANHWPLRHLKVDWEAAAEELRDDYTEVTFLGVEYLVRSV